MRESCQVFHNDDEDELRSLQPTARFCCIRIYRTMPTHVIPYMWTPRGSMNHFRKHPHKPHTTLYSPPTNQPPIRGTFAGLSPRGKRASSSGAQLAVDPDELLATADELEYEAPMNLPRLLGYILATADIDPDVQAAAWDPTRSGSVTRAEFRLRVKGLLQSHGCEEVAGQKEEAESLFDAEDADRSGIVDVGELRRMLTRLKAEGIEALESVERAERLARAARLRDIAALAQRAQGLIDHAGAAKATAADAKLLLEADLEVQLGLAFTRRRIKASDCVGQYSSGADGMNNHSFLAMATALLPNHFMRATGFGGGRGDVRGELTQLFGSLDADGSGTLDMKEAASALASIQKRAIERTQEHDLRAKRAEHSQAKASKAVHVVNSEWRAEQRAQQRPSGRERPLRGSPPTSPDSTHTLALGNPDSSAGNESERARHERARQTAIKAMKRLRNQSSISSSWNTWVEYAANRHDNMTLVRSTMMAFLSHLSRRALATWQSYCEQVTDLRKLTRKVVLRMKAQGLARAFAQWREPLLSARLPPPGPCEALVACLAMLAQFPQPVGSQPARSAKALPASHSKRARSTAADTLREVVGTEGPSLDEMRAALHGGRRAASGHGNVMSRSGSRPRLQSRSPPQRRPVPLQDWERPSARRAGAGEVTVYRRVQGHNGSSKFSTFVV